MGNENFKNLFFPKGLQKLIEKSQPSAFLKAQIT